MSPGLRGLYWSHLNAQFFHLLSGQELLLLDTCASPDEESGDDQYH